MNGKTLGVLFLLIILALMAFNLTTGAKHAPVQAEPLQATLAQAEPIQGPPTLSAVFIQHVLVQAGSPAAKEQGFAQTLYRLSLSSGIDDAVALAFFHHESGYGIKGMALSTHSLGNIRCSQGYACDPTGGYRRYPTFTAGAQDWYALILSGYIQGHVSSRCPCLTVSTIIPVYAPGSDHNNESAYIQSVLSDVVQFRHEEVQR